MRFHANTIMSNDTVIDTTPIIKKIDAYSWPNILQDLDKQGFSILKSLLTISECEQLELLYGNDILFRSRVNMQRYRFGRGEYQYFTYPLPSIIQSLRVSIYTHLVSLANRWSEALGTNNVFPEQLHDFLDICHQKEQKRPTPLLLKYEIGDFNCLHQDLYGDLSFPMQTAIVLNEPGRDFTGGEFVLSEQKPRSQAQVHVLNLQQGDAVVFAVSHRPVKGSRGISRVNMNHGISSLHSGQRYCLGVIFHDAT
jgi:uncharacterized protein